MNNDLRHLPDLASRNRKDPALAGVSIIIFRDYLEIESLS